MAPVDITYFVMKDVLARSLIAADNIFDVSVMAGLDCVPLDNLPPYEKPADLTAQAYNPYSTRYVDDGRELDVLYGLLSDGRERRSTFLPRVRSR
jgi:hypothetical protein